MNSPFLADASQVVLMAKPDGCARCCRADDVVRVHACWRDTVSWLRGADPDDVEHADVVLTVARKAALRMPRYDTYDITAWMDEARDIPVTVPSAPTAGPLIGVTTDILAGLGFTQVGDAYDGWLNRVTIELMYRQANAFTANRDLLTPILLKGPVAIRYLEGTRIALAHAVKLVVRAAVSSSGSSLANLIHLDPVTAEERRLISASLVPSLESMKPWTTASLP